MPGRIRRSVEAAMGQVDATAATAMRVLLDAAERGVDIRVQSILGIPIPETVIRLQLVDPDDGPPVNPDYQGGN